MLTYSRTHDCPPTLTDTQVLDFSKNGFLMLEGIVPDEVNRRRMTRRRRRLATEPRKNLM